MRGSRVFVDTSPLRDFPGFRRLWTSYVIRILGDQMLAVAIPYQVYRLTNSTLDVGLVSLAQLGGLLLGSFGGGSLADFIDRKTLLLVVQVCMCASAAGLALNASSSHPGIWLMLVFGPIYSFFSGIDNPTRSALVANLVDRVSLVNANALWQVLFQVGQVVGPAIAGVLIARVGMSAVYWIAAGATLVAFFGLFRVTVPDRTFARTAMGPSALFGGLRYLRREQILQAVFLVDLNAMVFGMPRALFPALGLHHFHGGPSTVGLLYSAPGAGALLAAVFMGWVASIRRQGRAVLIAVAAWGAAIVAFGFSNALWLALLFLGIAGASDVVSAVFRSTILQIQAPEELRGRLQGVQSAVVVGGPRLGDFESGSVAAAFGTEFSVVSGGILCLVGVAVLSGVLPRFARYEAPEHLRREVEMRSVPRRDPGVGHVTNKDTPGRDGAEHKGDMRG